MTSKKSDHRPVYATPKAGQFPLKQFRQFGSSAGVPGLSEKLMESLPAYKTIAARLRTHAANIKRLRKSKEFSSLGSPWSEKEINELLLRADQWDQVGEGAADTASIRPMSRMRVLDEIHWLFLTDPDEPTLHIDENARDNDVERVVVEDTYGFGPLLAIFEEAANVLYAQSNQGDDVAAEVLVQAAVALIERVNLLAEKNPERLLNIAGALPHWPMLAKRNDNVQKDADRIFDRLKVGSKSAFSGVFRKGRKPDFKKTANVIVTGLFDYLQLVREEAPLYANSGRCEIPDWVDKLYNLPKLTDDRSKKNFKEWFEIAWKALAAVCPDGKPEQDGILRQLGEHKKNHSLHRGTQKKVTPRTMESNIRTGIKEALRQAAIRIIIPLD